MKWPLNPSDIADLELVPARARYCLVTPKVAESIRQGKPCPRCGYPHVVPENAGAPPECAKIGCDARADFEICDLNERAPSTANVFACEAHVGELLGMRLEAPNARWEVRPAAMLLFSER